MQSSSFASRFQNNVFLNLIWRKLELARSAVPEQGPGNDKMKKK
jgi:hypothetical protein